jgi:hypothetical protein
LIAAGYSTNTGKFLQSLASTVAGVDPQAVADIYGYLAEAVKTSSWTTANQNLFLYGKATDTILDFTAAGSLVGDLESAQATAGGTYDSDIVAADSVLGTFTVSGTPYATWDETPIVNF